MCKKQTAVSHSSTESETISLDAGLRLDGLLALELCDLIVSVFGNVTQTSGRTGRPVDTERSQKFQGKINVLKNIDCLPSKVQSSRREALWYVFEDNEAVIKMFFFFLAEVLQWDMFPELTELLLIGCSVESIWTPKSKSSTLTPKTNSHIYWPREFSHVMYGIIFCVCLTLAISVEPSVFWSDVDLTSAELLEKSR